MRLKIVILLAVVVPQIVSAQIEWRENGHNSFDQHTRFLFQANGFRSDYSNTINREFIQTAILGGHIDQDLKADMRDNLKENNSYAGLMNASAYLTFFPDSAKLGFTIGYEYSHYVGLHFSQDFYQLAMYGNDIFGERTADLSDTREDYFNYQRFAFGVVHKSSGAFLSIGAYSGVDQVNYQVDDMNLTTQYGSLNGFQYAESLEVQVENFSSKESVKKDGLFKNGYGFGLSGGHSFKIKNGRLNVSFNDLGVMNWTNLETRDTTGTINFDGVQWNYDDESNISDIFDSLSDSIVPQPIISDKWQVLPGKIRVVYYTSDERKLMASLGASYQWGLNLNPEVEARLFYDYGVQNIVWLSGSFGGFYGAALGIGTEVEVLDNSALSLGSRYVFGLVSENSRATNFFIKYSLRI